MTPGDTERSSTDDDPSVAHDPSSVHDPSIAHGPSSAHVAPSRRDAHAIDAEAAEAIFDALSSETARAILARLHERPRTPSGIEDVVDTSLQNVGHHLDQLEAAGLVEAVGAELSGQGREMKLFAPTAETLVLYAGDEPPRGAPADDAPPGVGGAASDASWQGRDPGRPGRHDGWPAPPVSFALGALAGSVATTLWRSLRR